MAGDGQQFYSESDAQEILRRAASVHAPGGLSREELLRSAAELGVSPEAVARAEAEYLAEREQSKDLEEFRRQHRSDFRTHLVVYTVINTFLLCINLLTSADHLWFIYPLLGWGIGIAIHGYATYNENSNEWRQEFEEWKMKRQPLNDRQLRARKVIEEELEMREESDLVGRLNLIKTVKEQTGLSLNQSKDTVDEYIQQNPGSRIL